MIPINYSSIKDLQSSGSELELAIYAMSNSQEYNGASISETESSIDFYDVLLMHINVDGRGRNEPLLEFEELSEEAAVVIANDIERELNITYDFVGPNRARL